MKLLKSRKDIYPGVGVGTSDFKWRGWSKDFLGLRCSIPGFFGVGKFGKFIFGVAWFIVGIFSGIQINLKIRDSACSIMAGEYK